MSQDLTFEEMFAMQEKLNERHKHDWDPLEPEIGRNQILWMVEEVGEVIAIIKKKGPENIIGDPTVRAAFLEEVCDVLMYLNDTLICYGVKPEEIAQAYRMKHERNMKRDFDGDNQRFLSGKE